MRDGESVVVPGATIWPQEGIVMRKSEIDHMLEVAVAKALGVKLPHLRTGVRPSRKSAHAHRPVKHAA
jgi:hypothetical protein